MYNRWEQTNDKSVNRESTQGVDASQAFKYNYSNICYDEKSWKHSHDETGVMKKLPNNSHDQTVGKRFNTMSDWGYASVSKTSQECETALTSQ